jgi:hypothetical protein
MADWEVNSTITTAIIKNAWGFIEEFIVKFYCRMQFKFNKPPKPLIATK